MLLIPDEDILDYFRNYYEYNPETGELFKHYETTFTYKLITGTTSEGYIRVYLRNKEYRGHHVCWFLHYKEWPKTQLDHKNRIRHDNRIINLQEATPAMQTANLSTQSKHGRCIWYKSRINRYEVCIRRDKQRIYVGVFKTPEEAMAARDNKERELGYGAH